MRYLTNSDELQIKISQGAKPGEAENSWEKVDDYIAKIDTQNLSWLISPPPHHDIYSMKT